MTSERLEEMANILIKDQNVARELLTKSPEEALAWFKAQGFDCTMDDVMAFAEKINVLIAAKENGELGEADLENVAGGGSGWIFAAGVIVGVAMCCAPW